MTYAWTHSIEAWTVAVTNRPDLVLEAYGAEPLLDHRTFGEAGALQADAYPALLFHGQLRDHGAQVVVLESNGWTGSVPEVARRCSAAGGHFFSVYWNVNAHGCVTEGKDGVITAKFEVLYPFQPEQLSSEVRPGWALGSPTDLDRAYQDCLTHLEEQTGVRIQQEWLDERLPTYRIADPATLYPDPWV
ncbi:hypothetical protein ACFCV3_38480 [Kribbella sp. NPDC056345]|uniref:hypothetical protein n=1 Tax=Kribbella sp. NPDC056345 TaxID=3345789 RepID=UPI0035D8A8D4